MADTAKEKALKVIAKQIHELDRNKLALDVLDSAGSLFAIRLKLYGIIAHNSFELTPDYKLKLQVKK